MPARADAIVSSSTPAQSRTVVLGLGNPILTDDAAGLAVAEGLGRLLEQRPIPGIDIRTSARGGFELLELLSGYDQAVIIDSYIVPEPEPGRIHLLGLDKLSGCARLVCSHEITVAEVFSLASRMAVPMPAAVTIFGIEVKDPYTFAERMNPEIEAAAGELAGRLYQSFQKRLT